MTVKTKENKEAKTRFIKVTRAHQFEDGSISFDMEVEDITIYNCTLREGKNGTFVSFPFRKGKDGKYYSYVKCDLSKEDTANIIEQIEQL